MIKAAFASTPSPGNDPRTFRDKVGDLEYELMACVRLASITVDLVEEALTSRPIITGKPDFFYVPDEQRDNLTWMAAEALHRLRQVVGCYDDILSERTLRAGEVE